MKGFESTCKSFFCCSMVAILTFFFFPCLGEASPYSITDLYAGSGNFYATGINDSNQIISYSGDNQSYVIEGSVYTPFNVPGAYGTYANAINNDGNIAGYYKPTDRSNGIGFFWDGTKTDILPTGATSSYVYGMNDSDKLVGIYSPPNTFPSFVSDGATFENIIIPGAGRTFAMDINNNDEILGGYYDASNTWHNYILDGSNLTILSLLEGHRAYGFNDVGQIVGRYTAIDGTMTAYIFDMVADTYTYIDNLTGIGWVAEDINNEGVVVGWYRQYDGSGGTTSIHGFVADPVPEPSTILLLGSGLLGLSWYGRKRKKV